MSPRHVQFRGVFADDMTERTADASHRVQGPLADRVAWCLHIHLR